MPISVRMNYARPASSKELEYGTVIARKWTLLKLDLQGLEMQSASKVRVKLKNNASWSRCLEL